MLRIQKKMEGPLDNRARTKLRERLRNCIGRYLAKGLLVESDQGTAIAGSEVLVTQFDVHQKLSE